MIANVDLIGASIRIFGSGHGEVGQIINLIEHRETGEWVCDVKTDKGCDFTCSQAYAEKHLVDVAGRP